MGDMVGNSVVSRFSAKDTTQSDSVLRGIIAETWLLQERFHHMCKDPEQELSKNGNSWSQAGFSVLG